MIDPNDILPAPPILLPLHHLRHLRDLRSPPIGCLFVGHHDDQGYLSVTDKACCWRWCCWCCFFCTRDNLYAKLLRRLRMRWPPATDEAIGPKATRTRRGRRCLFGRNMANVDGQWLRFQPHQPRIIQGLAIRPNRGVMKGKETAL